jgi:hypothetical protein
MSIDEIATLLYERVCGTCDGLFMCIDELTDNGDLDKDFFEANEFAIMQELDQRMFCCETCNWNVDVGDMSDTEMVCHDCYEGD